MLSKEQMDKLWDRFHSRIKGFKSFENPGDLEKEEIAYKRKALQQFQEEIGNGRLQQFIAEGKSAEALKKISKILTTNIVSPYSWKKVFGETEETIAPVLRAFLQVSEQEYKGPETIRPLFEAISKVGCKPFWDVIPVLLWALRPEDYFPVKISYYRLLAKELGIEIEEGLPNPESLHAMREFGLLIWQSLDPIPRDWIDVQSFMWVVCPNHKNGNTEKAKFSWIPIYKKIAEAVLNYRNDQKALIDMLRQVSEQGLPMVALKDKLSDAPESPQVPLEVMDPFTFFASFNRSLTDANRCKIIALLQSSLGLDEDVPGDFDGIPFANNQKSWFFGYSFDRNEGDIDALWDLADQVFHRTPEIVSKETFERCLEIWGIGKSNLTMGCFWLNPQHFLSVDSVNDRYLQHFYGIHLDFKDFHSYCALLEDVKKQVSEAFVELSHKAFKYVTQGTGDWPPGNARIWLIGAGRNSHFWEEFQELGIIAVGGTFDSLEGVFSTQDEIKARLVDLFPNVENPIQDAKAFFDFVHAMKVGDLVFVKRGRREIIGYGQIQSDYIHESAREEYRHVRKMQWMKCGSWLIENGRQLPIKTLTEITSDKKLLGLLQSLLNLGGQKGENEPIPTVEPVAVPLPSLKSSYSIEEMAIETGISVGQLRQWRGSLERKGQCVFYGPPGTGKTYIAERMARHLISGGDGFVDLVQFHPAYSYEDFIQGIRPQTRDDGGLEYLLVPGQFLKFCQRAMKCKGTCVLIIDEINRANLAKVFGERMYLLEYRDKKIPLASGNMLEIPSNVRIIGTMNTADRSIALVDHALRRRFAFLALYPDYDVLRKYHSGNGFNVEGLILTLQKLNAQIDDRHYQVGISFFLREDLNNAIEDIWRVEIEPYIEEFFFDRPARTEGFRWEQIKNSILGE